MLYLGQENRESKLKTDITPLLVKAARREQLDRPPIWFMRQAGRVLPEYREIRKKFDLLSITRNSDLAAEVTLQPVNKFDLDAAIIFADIVTPLHGIGVELDIVEGVGPVIANPVNSCADLNMLREIEPNEDVPYILDSLSRVRKSLPSDKALIGFAGAPFTLATYLIEGGPSRNYSKTKSLMYSDPKLWHELMIRLSRIIASYLRSQVTAGADIVQIFDSWVGWLSPSDYSKYVQPYIEKIIQDISDIDTPVIYFGTGTSTLLRLIKDTGVDVVGIDWRIPLDEAWAKLGYDVAVQGNLDPAALLGPFSVIESKTKSIIECTNGRPGHIFNLGHGFIPNTPLESIEFLVDLLRQSGAKSMHPTSQR